MVSEDRPAPRRRPTPAPDEAAGTTPIDPPRMPESSARRRPQRVTYAQLNVRLEAEYIEMFERIQDHDDTNQVDTIRVLIREGAERRRLS